MRFLAVILCVFSTSFADAQRYRTTSSSIEFFSDAPLEDIKAVNTKATSIIDVTTRAMVIAIPIKSFVFKKKLMQEHFNENYLESDTYPKAVFKGKISDWSGEEGTVMASAIGTLEIHGVTKEVEISGQLVVGPESLKLSTTFFIQLSDYDIAIPTAVFYKIAEQVEVTATLEYAPYDQN